MSATVKLCGEKLNKSTGNSTFCAGTIATTTCCWRKWDIMVRDNTSATQNTRFAVKGVSGLYFLICFTHSAIYNKWVINYIIKIFPVRYPNSFFSFHSSSISLVHTKLNKIHSPIHWHIRVSVQHAIDALLWLHPSLIMAEDSCVFSLPLSIIPQAWGGRMEWRRGIFILLYLLITH